MKKLILLLAAAAMAGCANAPQPIVQNSNSTAPSNERSQTAIAHGPATQQPPANSTGGQSKWTQGGDAIDTSAFDAAIAKGEKAVADKPDDAAAKKALAEFYLARANALTGARQYASALGDYRRTLKYDPTNQEAKDWVGQIIAIYSSINRSYPAEGEEPPPLPFKKDDKKAPK